MKTVDKTHFRKDYNEVGFQKLIHVIICPIFGMLKTIGDSESFRS